MAAMTDLRHYIRTYDGALSQDFCARVIERFEADRDRQRRNGANIRAGLAESSWLEMDLSQCQEFNFRNIVVNCLRHHKSAYERDCGIRPALPEPRDLAPLIVKRYDPGGGDRFQPHYDSVGEVSDRYMVFLWYLNDVAEGGETEFLDLEVRCQPRCGRLLVFPPFWMYRHAGRPPLSSTKYILSTYTLW